MADAKKGRGLGWGKPIKRENDSYLSGEEETVLHNDGTRSGTGAQLASDMLALESKARKKCDLTTEMSARMHRLITVNVGEVLYGTDSEIGRKRLNDPDFFLLLMPAALNAFASALTSYFMANMAFRDGVDGSTYADTAGSTMCTKEEMVTLAELSGRTMMKDVAALCGLHGDDLKDVNMDALREAVTMMHRRRPKEGEEPSDIVRPPKGSGLSPDEEESLKLARELKGRNESGKTIH